MAGKVQLSKFPVGYKYDVSEIPYVKHTPPSAGWNMEEDVVLDQLSDQSFKKRAEILDHLIISARRNGGRLPYSDVHSIYQGLEHALADSNWDVRLKCVRLINETIPHIEEIDSCMSLVLSQLIPNLGDTKIAIRRAVIQTLHVYMKNTRNVQLVLRAIIKYGLDCEDSRVRKETMISLPMLFTPEFASEDFFEVSFCLAKRLADSGEDNLMETAFFTMGKVRNLVGDNHFNQYIQKFPPQIRKLYVQLASRPDENGFEFRTSSKIMGSPVLSSRSSVPFHLKSQLTNKNDSDEVYEFGIIPSHLMQQLENQEDFKSRSHAVEELRNTLQDLYRLDLLIPHLEGFIIFLSSLLEDDNFKITIVTLDMLNILASKLGSDVKNYIRSMVSLLTKRMSDNKIVVRSSIMKVSMQLMQSYSPKPVLSVICENLQHRNSKVRQETLNVIIASLLKFPSCDFDLGHLCEIIGPCLLDSKRQVRQAVLECYAVLAQAMGNGKLRPLANAVDLIEVQRPGAEGAMAAVQARLSRRQLPKIGVDGLVELATPLTNAGLRGGMLQGADIDWIMAASSGGTGSARTSRSEMVELESVSSRTSSAVSRDESARPVAAPRRIVSAGRGKNKLPWEESREDWGKAYDSMPGTAPAKGGQTNQINDAPPIQPRMTWGGEETIQDGKRGPRLDENSTNGPHKTTKVKRIGGQRYNNFDDEYSYRDSGWDSHRHTKTKLEPIPDAASPPPSPVEKVKGKDGFVQEETPIPMKPTLARGSAKQRNKVPPIVPSSDKYHTPRDLYDDDLDSAYAPSLESTIDREHQSEMNSSLRQIRNSASKKKAAKIFEKLEKEHSRQSMTSRSPSPPLTNTPFESGVYSPASTRDDWSDWSSRESSRKGGKRDNIFEAKPKLARVGSLKENKSSLPFEEEKLTKRDGSHQLEFNPISGVTFRPNKSSDVQIVGKGYGEETNVIDNKLSGPFNNKARDRRRLNKGSSLSPLGVASLHSYGALEFDEHPLPKQDDIGVIGRGMFDTAPPTLDQSFNNLGISERTERKQTKQTKNYPKGIYGIGVRQNSSDRQEFESSGDEPEDNEEELLSMSMSKSTRERMAQKKQQRQEEADKKRQDKSERERSESSRQTDSDSDSLTISGNSSGPSKYTSPTKPPHTISPRKKSKTGQQTNGTERSPLPVSASTKSLITSENPDDWEPFRDPDVALREAHKYMAQADWEAKCNGINTVRRLCKYHPDVLLVNLHSLIIAMIAEVKNLRSQVSRLAVVCFGEMFHSLKNKMDSDLDMATKALLAKNGESNGFIRNDVDTALSLMVDYATPQRALVALIAGAEHKNIAVRKTAAMFLVGVVEKMGPGRILSGVKDITDKILPQVALFVMDSSPETRYHGRKILHFLMNHQDFDRMLSKHLSANTYKSISDVVENLRIKGLGEMPSESTSARSRRSGHGSRSSSFRGSSATSGVSGVMDSTKRRVTRTDDRTQEEIKQMLGLLVANDWRDRYRGIEDFLDMCESNTSIVGSQIVKIFDKFLPRLQDNNSKVNLYALQVMLMIIPMLKDWFSSVITLTVQNVCPNLNSKNTEIKQVANNILDLLLEQLDASLLVQPFANQSLTASARSQHEMVEKVADLVTKMYGKKHRQVTLHVLPLLWSLLGVNNSGRGVGSGSSPLRTATIKLIHSLYDLMGESLIDQAQSTPSLSSKHVELLHNLLEQ